MTFSLRLSLFILLFSTLAACAPSPQPLSEKDAMSTAQAYVTSIAPPTATPSPTPLPPRVLTICVGQEPTSLFPYADDSRSARVIRQAIYDGPVDRVNGELAPVILERLPSLANGDAQLRPVEVQPGELIADALGEWVALQEGVRYRPSGCISPDCALTYAGDQPVQMDELVVRFRLLPDIQWSDGTPLTAQDSVYAYQVARRIFGNTWEMLRFTRSYTAPDSLTVEWVSLPGYQGEYVRQFFSPLPQHLWGQMSVDELIASELSARIPMGWGPYVLAEWVPGDHITLNRNPRYFRAAEGLPYFDHLVFRFAFDGDAAVDALLVGECDLVDATAVGREQMPRLLSAQAEGQVQLAVQTTAAFEQIIFGIEPFRNDQPAVFADPAVRQAVAQCLDREALVNALYDGFSTVAESYLPPGHPLAVAGLSFGEYDPEAGKASLTAAGWVDDDDEATPRVANGVAGVVDGTPLKVDYLVPQDAEREAAAARVKADLARCGIEVEVKTLPWEQFLQPGPEGAVFGRRFQMAQFAWAEGLASPCELYLSTAIPGPYPEFLQGWGGGNLGGFRNADFDLACQTGQSVLPDTGLYRQANQDAQQIFAATLPALPLYWHVDLSAARPEVCLGATGISGYTPAYLEMLKSGRGCVQK